MINGRFAQLMTLLANINRDGSQPPVRVEQFMFSGWPQEPEPEAPEASLARFMDFAISQGTEIPESVTEVVNTWRSSGDGEVQR